MAKFTVHMVQNDTGPPLTFDIYKADGTKYTDMASGSAKFKIKDTTTGNITNGAHQPCTLGPATNQVTYNFAAGDIPNAGSYICDLEITDLNGVIQTIPEYVELVVRAEVG